MFLCLSDGKQPTTSWELLKNCKSQKLQIVYGNEKLDTILSQVNAPENSQQSIANTQSGFQPFASIITERLDNIQIYESNNYLREEIKKECKRTLQKIKQTNLWLVFKETSKVKKTNKNTVELKPYIHWAIL